MENEVAHILKDILCSHDKNLYKKPELCYAYLLDYCGTHKKEIKVLETAAKGGIPAKLLESSSISQPILHKQLAKRLQDENGMAEDASIWAVDAWAYALSVKDILPKNIPSDISKKVTFKNNENKPKLPSPHRKDPKSSEDYTPQGAEVITDSAIDKRLNTTAQH